MIKRLLPFIALMLVALPEVAAAKDIKVVSTIRPVHSLAAQILDGVGEPYLLIKGKGSPHDYSMRPSDARALADADVIFWMGPALETFLVDALKSLPKSARVIALGPEDQGHRHKDEHKDGHGHGHAAGNDPHTWLNPSKANDMIDKMTEVLSEVYPDHIGRFNVNREGANLDLRRLNMKMSLHISAYADAEIVVLHDAYGHFTEQFGLKPFTALSLTPEHQPGAKRIAEIRAFIQEKGVKCVFSEPQYPDKYLDVLVEGTNAKTGVIDPLGSAIEPGPDLYDGLMGSIFTSIWECLSQR